MALVVSLNTLEFENGKNNKAVFNEIARVKDNYTIFDWMVSKVSDTISHKVLYPISKSEVVDLKDKCDFVLDGDDIRRKSFSDGTKEQTFFSDKEIEDFFFLSEKLNVELNKSNIGVQFYLSADEE